MSYFGLTEESNGINLSKEGLSSPYILNVTNNSNQEKTVTVFNANDQLQQLNNPALDGVVGIINTTDNILFTFGGYVNNKPFFTFTFASTNYIIQWSPSVLSPPNFAWLLISLPTPVINYELTEDIPLPISTNNWQQINMSSLITSISTKREVQAISNIPGVNYEQILNQSTVEPFKVGLTQIYSSNVNQLLEPFQRVEKDANGTITKIPFVPTIDPYQNNVVLLEFADNYTIDGDIGLQFRALANTSVKLVIYPTTVIKPQNTLESIDQIEDYKAPEQYKGKEIVLPTKDENFSSFSGDKKRTYKPILVGIGLLATLYLIFRKWD